MESGYPVRLDGCLRADPHLRKASGPASMAVCLVVGASPLVHWQMGSPATRFPYLKLQCRGNGRLAQTYCATSFGARETGV